MFSAETYREVSNRVLAVTTVRAAVVQAAAVGFNLEAGLDKVERLAAEASISGAQLVVFPEAFLPGYPKGITFGTVVGDRTPEGREHFQRYFEASVDVPGSVVDRLVAIAAENSIYAVVPVVERDGGTLYCTALFFSPEGYLGKHRKLLPTAAERLVWGFGDGSTMPVFDTPVGRLGAVICWENYMPLLRMSMYAKGIQIWCAPTADGRETWLSTMRHVALEGRCFVLSCNQFTRGRDFPRDIPNALATDPDDVLSSGGSCIIGPLGEILAGPARSGEETLFADLDLGAITRGKFDFDVAGHYARPDVFRLLVDESPKPPVATNGAVQPMPTNGLSVAVLGPGAVGGLLAALLARGGNSIEVLASDNTSRAIAERGLRIESQRFGDFQVSVRSAARLEGPIDACLVTVKNTQLIEALERVPSDALGEGLLVPFLNGIEHVDVLRRIYPASNVVSATIREATARVEPGSIRQTSPFASVEIAASAANRDRVERLAAQMRAAGLDVRVRDDETSMLWDKLSFLAPLALLTTHERANAGAIRTRRRVDTVAVIREVAAVANAEGAAIDSDAVVRFLDSVPDTMESSMQHDQAAGRPMELDAIGGAVVRRAARAGVDVPVTAHLVEQLRSRA